TRQSAVSAPPSDPIPRRPAAACGGWFEATSHKRELWMPIGHVRGRCQPDGRGKRRSAFCEERGLTTALFGGNLGGKQHRGWRNGRCSRLVELRMRLMRCCVRVEASARSRISSQSSRCPRSSRASYGCGLGLTSRGHRGGGSSRQLLVKPAFEPLP